MAATLRKVTVATTATTVVPASPVISTGSRNVRFVNRSQVPITLGNGDILSAGDEQTFSLAYTSTFTCTAPTSTTIEVYDDYSTVGPQIIAAAATDVASEFAVSGDVHPRVRELADGTRLEGGGDFAPVSQIVTASPVDPTAYGFYLFPPSEISAVSAAITTQNLRLTFFRAPVTQAITKVYTTPGATQTATGFTYAGYAIYSEDSDGGLTLLAKYEDTASPPTTIFDTANTPRTTTLTATVNFVKGKRYAAGPLVVFTGGSFTIPAKGLDLGGMRGECTLGAGSRQGIVITGGSTIPATISAATVTAASGSMLAYYCRFVP